MAIHFPRALLRAKSDPWNLAGVAVAGGQTELGVASLTRSDGGGFWTCSLSDVSLSGRNGIADKGRQRQRNSTLLWRAVRQICDGGVVDIVVPRNDALYNPWPDGVARKAGIDLSHDDGALFSDGAGYYQSMIDITCCGADLRATSLDISIALAGELIGGESFSIEHETRGWRLYEIATVEMTGDDTATITFNPPLREAIEDGTRLEFDRPCCLMRLTQPSSMNLAPQAWTFNRASVDFVEAPLT
ncbi:hypothetical protein [Bradyrhizobium liaoningense]|uniref:hypothetical protein n=1 Tax=Bradyrhizobium liaoningense TaxID=43992 RepID=UPI001FE61550|nr:hypothetical protein [Bradyrhizobium liaoningense]